MFFIIFVVHFIYIGISSTEVSAQCVAPPMECPNVNITFWLYTRANENDPYQVFPSDFASMEDAPWVKGAPVKILIHGYTGHRDFAPSVEIRPAYLKCCDYNIISVDYNPIAREPCYIEGARNTELVGKCIAHLIDQLVQDHGFSLSQFHIIGFSLGGQAAGFVGNYVTGTLDRITGLDPALPLFVTNDPDKKIDKFDAKFVDVLHTNALEKGKLESSGTVDFYANGGITQPGCETTRNDTRSGCSHARAPKYYAESINTDAGFYAAKCYSWITYMIGWCELFNSADDVLFGEHVPHDAKGLYFFRTNSEAPYARGSNTRNKRNLLSYLGL
ncbi:unnamed protein product [Chrysodeixis includens]|uniref:Lipase domain-containing protein n=1 Tax=Chrysodeixis includens TaxID=689277 RepID=A0A9P0FS94_CHRIL|nr:unnamed protein product [Chrysodeixis includens]